MKDRALPTFDFSAPADAVEASHFHLTKSCFFVVDKKTGDFYLTAATTPPPPGPDFAQMKIELGAEMSYISTQGAPLTIADKMWQVVSGRQSNKGAQLFENDCVRFGQSIVKVVRLQSSPDEQVLTGDSASHSPLPRGSGLQITQRPTSTQFCRICQESNTADAPLCYDVCSCAQESPVHLDCFVDWLKKRVIRRFNSNARRIDFSRMQCEKCQYRFANEYPFLGERVKIFDIDQPVRNPHVILAVSAPNSEEVVAFYVYEFDKKFSNAILRVGSDVEREVQLLDFTVEDLHAQMIWAEGRLFVVDENSKSGTAKKLADLVGFDVLAKQKLLVDKLMLSAHLTSADKPCSCSKAAREARVDPFVTSPQPKPPIAVASQRSAQAPTTSIQNIKPVSARLLTGQGNFILAESKPVGEPSKESISPSIPHKPPHPNIPAALPPQQAESSNPFLKSSQLPLPPPGFEISSTGKPLEAGLLSVYTAERERKPNLIKMEFAMDNFKAINVHPVRQEDYATSEVVRGFKVEGDRPPFSEHSRRQPLPEIPEEISRIPAKNLDSSLSEWRESNLIRGLGGKQSQGTIPAPSSRRFDPSRPFADSQRHADLIPGSQRTRSPPVNYHFN